MNQEALNLGAEVALGDVFERLRRVCEREHAAGSQTAAPNPLATVRGLTLTSVPGVLAAEPPSWMFDALKPLTPEKRLERLNAELERQRAHDLNLEQGIRDLAAGQKDFIESALALRDEIMRQEGRAEERAARRRTRTEAGQKQPGRPRIRGGEKDFEDLDQLRSEKPGQTCEAQFREALLQEGVDKDTSRRRYVLADARWNAVRGK
jgi:hypothetical protein